MLIPMVCLFFSRNEKVTALQSYFSNLFVKKFKLCFLQMDLKS